MRYYIADCHFWHSNLLTRMDKRPFQSVEEMNEYIISQWNKKVRKNDEVVILGDFCMAGAKETNEIVRQLNGKRFYLVTGNHDKIFLRSRDFDRSRFVQITPYLELRDNKRKVVCCHYPIMEYNGMFRKNESGEQTTWMLYGHIHNSVSNRYVEEYKNIVSGIERPMYRKGHDNVEMKPAKAQMINCFCMRSNYMPLTLDEWIALEGKDR